MGSHPCANVMYVHLQLYRVYRGQILRMFNVQYSCMYSCTALNLYARWR